MCPRVLGIGIPFHLLIRGFLKKVYNRKRGKEKERKVGKVEGFFFLIFSTAGTSETRYSIIKINNESIYLFIYMHIIDLIINKYRYIITANNVLKYLLF